MPDYEAIGLWGLLLLLVHVLGIVCAAHAVLHVHTTQAAIAWAISLVTFPTLTLPLYWVFGSSKFAGYIRSRRAGNQSIDTIAKQALSRLVEYRADVADEPDSLCRSVEQLTNLPCTGMNTIDLLIDGGDVFSAMLEAIAAAQHYVLVQFFVVEEGRLSDEFCKVLTEKVREGVRVYFLFDEIGSRKLRHDYIHRLQQSGVRMSAFHTSRGAWHRFRINFRNHRKIAVIDGRVAFLGGLNLGDVYIGMSRHLSPWRDTHVSVQGPAVQVLQLGFVEDWHWATGEVLDIDWEPVPGPGEARRAMVVATGPADELEVCQLFVLGAIHAARARLWIASPYFVPDPATCAALKLAVVRGVDVRILLPQRPDHILVYLAAFSYYEEMMAAGVKLYRYQPGFVHQKVMLIDSRAATVGTVNLDHRSFHLNFEVTLLVPDQNFAREVEVMLARDFEQSRRAALSDFTDRSLLFRLSVRVSRLLSPIL